MVILSADELTELRERVTELQQAMRSRMQHQKKNAAANLMRLVCWHDWPEWAPQHGWCVPPHVYDDVSGHRRRQRLRQLVDAVVGFLESGDDDSEQELVDLLESSQWSASGGTLNTDRLPHGLILDTKRGTLSRKGYSKIPEAAFDRDGNPWRLLLALMRGRGKITSSQAYEIVNDIPSDAPVDRVTPGNAVRAINNKMEKFNLTLKHEKGTYSVIPQAPME